MSENKEKSKFVYPDKLYARTNNNITLDISYAPQTLEAVEYVRTDAFVEKACEWFRRIDYDDSIPPFETTEEFIEGFKKAMKGE